MAETSATMHPGAIKPGQSISLVCVYNNVAVRKRCLDRSIEEHEYEHGEVELIAVDNRNHEFASAGAALNHGAALARHNYIAFVHQDVYLHSLNALGRAAQALADEPTIGVIGPVGIDAGNSIIGRTRDRVTLIGRPAPTPTEVDSLDEVLFMVSRETLRHQPLTESPDLAWHAYAVEYSLRMKAAGRAVRAIDIPLTHNSLTINLDRLDVAHASVANSYPDVLPIQTTCGTVKSRGSGPQLPRFLDAQRWRWRWLKESAVAHRLRRRLPGVPIVLSDIRQNIDDVIAGTDGILNVINTDPHGSFHEDLLRPLTLQRIDRTITVRATSVDSVPKAVESLDANDSLLVTNLRSDDLHRIRTVVTGRACLLGLYDQNELWLLVGPAVRGDIPEWRSRRARPLGTPPRPNPAYHVGQPDRVAS